MNGKWLKEEDDYLKNNYCKGKKEDIILKLNRTWNAIGQRSSFLKIKREVFNPKKSNVNKLIDGSYESFYWLGFIMADGHFHNNNQIQINLSVKDFNHLKKLATFIEYKKELTKPRISIGFGEIRNILDDMFKLSNDKTHYPCNLDKLKGDLFFSFIIGFIDGDGSINKKGYLTIRCHKSWLNNLNEMISYLKNNSYKGGKISSDGLAMVSIGDIETMKNIKNKVIKLNLPVLSRKWDRVRFDKLSKRERKNIHNLTKNTR